LAQKTSERQIKFGIENILEIHLLALSKIYPKNYLAHHLLGLLYCYRIIPTYKKSEHYLMLALKLSRSDEEQSRILNCLANLNYEMANYKKAIIFYEQTIEKTKYKGLPLLNMAITYKKLRNKKKAFSVAQLAAKSLRKESKLKHSPSTTEELKNLLRDCARAA